MSEMNVEENLRYTPKRAEHKLQNYRCVLELSVLRSSGPQCRAY